MFYKIDFLAEKYVQITEDLFDMNSITAAQNLAEIFEQETVG